MFAVLHSDINSHKSGLLHLTGQPFCKKCRSAKVKDGIINLFLRNNLIDRYKWHLIKSVVMLSVANKPFMLSAVMLNVVTPRGQCYKTFLLFFVQS